MYDQKRVQEIAVLPHPLLCLLKHGSLDRPCIQSCFLEPKPTQLCRHAGAGSLRLNTLRGAPLLPKRFP
jgi:hypothetical protein